jgi:hypothetical protein
VLLVAHVSCVKCPRKHDPHKQAVTASALAHVRLTLYSRGYSRLLSARFLQNHPCELVAGLLSGYLWFGHSTHTLFLLGGCMHTECYVVGVSVSMCGYGGGNGICACAHLPTRVGRLGV